MSGHGFFPLECAPEIEQALVAGLWHQPHRLAETLRWLSPEDHLTQPYLRLVLSAITRCYSDLGDVDFATVTQCLRELGQLEECGGLSGLDALYEARWYAPVFELYGAFIRVAALRRTDQPRLPPAFFRGGSGVLTINKIRRSESSPQWIGTARVAGKAYSLRAYPAGDHESVNITFDPL